MDIKLGTLKYPKEYMTPFNFEIKKKKSKVKGQTGHVNILTAEFLENLLLNRHQTPYSVHLKE
jgi:hypothetical protein